MIGGVVRVSNGFVRSNGAVKRLFSSSSALRAAKSTKSGPAASTTAKPEIVVEKPEVTESIFVQMEKAYNGYAQRLESDSLNLKDLAATNVVGAFSVVTVLMWMDLIFG